MGDKIHYISFAARALHDGEKGYGATKRELLAIIYALEHFRYYLFGNQFTLFTDYRALTYIFTQKHTNQMINNWLETLLSFDFKIVHRPGILNVLPDAISRFFDADKRDDLDDEDIKIWTMNIEDSICWTISSKLLERFDKLFAKHRIVACDSVEDLGKIDWSLARLWLQPSIKILNKTIDAIILHKVQATLVTPRLEKESWFKRLITIQHRRAVLLNTEPGTFLPKGKDSSMKIQNCLMPPWDQSIIWSIDGRDPRQNRFEPVQFSAVTTSPDLINLRTLSHGTSSPKNTSRKNLSFSRMDAKSPRDSVSVPRIQQSLLPSVPETGSSNIIEVMDPLGVVDVPEELREILLNRAHLLGHFGAEAMYKSLFYLGHRWTSMRHDCLKTVKSCIACQRFNIGKHGFHPLTSISAQLPWDHIALDLKELARSKKGNKYLLVVVDVCTRFVFLRALKDKTMQSIASALLGIFFDVGFTKILQSDNGTEFVNSLLNEIVRLSKIDHRLITAYHPRANGLGERNVQTSSTSILKELAGKDDTWDQHHRSVQFYMNIRVSQYHGSRPYALLFARPVNGFQDFTECTSQLLSEEDLKKRLNYMTAVVYPTIAEKAKNSKDREGVKFIKNNLIITDQFPSGAQVMIKDELRTSKMQPRYTGPYTVKRRNQGGAYILFGKDGTEYTRPPSVLKLVSQDPVSADTSVAVEVQSILDDKTIHDVPHYLVKWKNRPAAFNQWVKETDFHDLGAIQQYIRTKNSCLTRKRKDSNIKPTRTVRFTVPPRKSPRLSVKK